MRQPLPGEDAVSAENELDIRGLFRTLWSGKVWIVGMALAFAIAALAYTFLRVRSGAPRRLLTGQRSICWVAFTLNNSFYATWILRPVLRPRTNRQ